MLEKFRIVLTVLRETRVFGDLEAAFEERVCLIILTHFQLYVSFELEVACHGRKIVGPFSEGILLVYFLQSLVKLTAIDLDNGYSKQRRPAFSIASLFVGNFLYLLSSLIRLSLVHLRGRN